MTATYNLNLVLAFLRKNDISFEYSSPKTGLLFETGVQVNIDNNIKLKLSVQTHPHITGDAFSETSMYIDGRSVFTKKWLYYDLRKQYTPDDLFEHITHLQSIVENSSIKNNILVLNNGEEIELIFNDG